MINLDSIFKKQDIFSDELIKLLKAREEGKIDFELIDIREPYENKELRIKGTDRLLPLTKLEKDIDIWNELIKKNIVIYCRSGNRTSHLQQFFRNYYNVNVPHLAEGIINYSGEVERG